MNRWYLLAAGASLFAVVCFAQTNPGDSQILQALLAEVRQLRQDLKTTTIATQRSQILVYRLQGQEAAVGRASQRLDQAREMLARTQDERKHVVADIKQDEDAAGSAENSAAQKSSIENTLAEFRMRLQSLESEEQQHQAR